MANLRDLLLSLFRPGRSRQNILGAKSSADAKPEPVTRNVLKIVHDPAIPGAGNQPLSVALRWNDHGKLTHDYIADLLAISHGYARFQIADEIHVDGFPVKEDGFGYEPDEYVAAWKARKGFHEPDRVDYLKLVRQFSMIERVDRGEIDEVWLFGFPYAGYYESIMAGPDAFWCNAPALKGTEHASRRFVIMGFSYQRGVGEMLENMGHRAESIMRHAYRQASGEANLWERFSRYHQTHPGRAEVGIMHFAPNSVRDYDWGNKTPVPSRWHTWRSFPDLSGQPRESDCKDWGDGDIRLHHKWWFSLLPHVAGRANGVSLNWWEHVIDPDTVR
jgi:hypothetical protein